MIEGDVGRVADFLITRNPVRIECRPGVLIGIKMVKNPVSRFPVGLVFDRAGQIGKGQELAVVVVKEIGDQAIDCEIGLFRVGIFQNLFEGDVVEQFVKTLDPMGILEAVSEEPVLSYAGL